MQPASSASAGTKKSVTSEHLRKPAHAKLLPDARAALHRQVTDVREWFDRNPAEARTRWLTVGLGLVGLGCLLVALGVVWHPSWPGIAVALVGVAVALTSSWAPVRTADGSAVLAQTRGFERYLTTAEADTLRLEDGTDVFSRYLPWAIAFGVAERWTQLFERLAAAGRYDLANDWYVGAGHSPALYYGSLGSLGDGLSSSMQAAASGSGGSTGGGPGFSGGGGFGGGGGGGW